MVEQLLYLVEVKINVSHTHIVLEQLFPVKRIMFQLSFSCNHEPQK